MNGFDQVQLSPLHRRATFADCVNRGDLESAVVYRDAVAAEAAAFGISGTATAEDTHANRAMTCFTLGIFALNHDGDRPAARRWLARAADLAELDPASDQIRQDAVIALSRAAEPVAMAAEARAPGGGTARRLMSRLGFSPVATPEPAIRFADLSERPDPGLLPPLDRPDVNEGALTPEQRAWRRDGVLILPKFLPAWLTDPYIARRGALESPGGWLSATPYLQVPELQALALYPPLMRMLEHVIGEAMLLHLTLTGWVSTERNWHQDDYLNPPFVNGWYAAVWMALDRIDPASGPFEYVPGSHLWPLLRGEKVRSFLTEEELTRTEAGVNHWPKYSERFVAPAIEAEISRHGVPPKTFLGEKGDVLIWHGRLMHRGRLAAEPGRERRSLISHYSGTEHRSDMTERAKDRNGQDYAVFDVPLH